MKLLVALGLAFTFEIITSKCIKLFIVHFFGKNIDNDNYILIRKMVHDIFFFRYCCWFSYCTYCNSFR